MPGMQHLYESAPLWVLALGFFLMLMLAREIGARIRRRREVSGGLIESDAEGFLINAVLGLLALLIAFTFGMALQLYNQRRELVIQEANALGTTWLRSDLLDVPDRARVRDALRAYVDARVAYGDAIDAEQEATAQRKSEVLQRKVWSTTVQAVLPFKDTALAVLIVSTTNESIDLAAEGYATRLAHIPLRIFRILLVYALVTACMVGYQRAANRLATTFMFVLLVLAVSLVIDLDRPASGMIRVPQQPMLDLQQSIRTPIAAAVIPEPTP